MLNPNTIYRKTDAGAHEVQSRELGSLSLLHFSRVLTSARQKSVAR